MRKLFFSLLQERQNISILDMMLPPPLVRGTVWSNQATLGDSWLPQSQQWCCSLNLLRSSAPRMRPVMWYLKRATVLRPLARSFQKTLFVGSCLVLFLYLLWYTLSHSLQTPRRLSLCGRRLLNSLRGLTWWHLEHIFILLYYNTAYYACKGKPVFVRW